MRFFLLSTALLALTGLPAGTRTLAFQPADSFFTKQFSARNLVVQVEDLTLTLVNGSVMTAEHRGITTLLFVGRGSMRFSPAPEPEKSQMRLIDGTDVFESPFDVAALTTVNPGAHVDLSALVPQSMDSRSLRRGYEAFPDLRLSPDTYGRPLMPQDVILDVKTNRLGALRYLRSGTALEAISLVSRASRKTLSIYPSTEQRASRGRSFREDEKVEYDVLHHDLSISYDPERRFIDGVAAMRVRITAERATQIQFRLAENLDVRSISMPGAGALTATRASRQEPSLVVSLPVALPRGTETTVVVSYSGRIAPPAAEWEMPRPAGGPQPAAIDHAQLTSTFPMWYPRPLFIDFATATMRISLPTAFDCVATGELADDSPTPDPDAVGRRVFTFAARQPLRHLAFLVAPFTTVTKQMLTVDDGPAGTTAAMPLGTVVQPRARVNAQATATAAADIVQFYRSIIGDVPYPSLTVALVDGQLPGGHSAAYFSVLGGPPPRTEPFWRTDPAAYDIFPNFVLAHEIAHQWWGQVVGWSSYHDQWMTEALAQYFATLHAGHQSGPTVVGDVLRRMRSWALNWSSQGPLSLGPRLGEIQDDDRVFRALLYNKGPAVLHMLRRFIGDAAFFEGTRKFFAAGRFQKPSTDDLRMAMEAASGRSLERFFDKWIDGSTLPQLRFSYRVEPRPGSNGDVVIRVEQTGELFDVPVTIQLQYADKPAVDEVVRVSERSTEVRVALAGRLRRAQVSLTDGMLATVR